VGRPKEGNVAAVVRPTMYMQGLKCPSFVGRISPMVLVPTDAIFPGPYQIPAIMLYSSKLPMALMLQPT
jgi:hypothetical protein